MSVSEHAPVTNRTTIEVQACQICGSDQALTDRLRPRNQFTLLPLRASAAFVYVSPRYSRRHDPQGLRQADYWQSDSPKTKGYASYADEAPLYLKTFQKRRLGFVKRYVPNPARKVLDVGCAAGYFLRVMQRGRLRRLRRRGLGAAIAK